MANFDLVIRNGTVATAADTFGADVGVKDGRVVALGENLGPGGAEIDASDGTSTNGGNNTNWNFGAVTITISGTSNGSGRLPSSATRMTSIQTGSAAADPVMSIPRVRFTSKPTQTPHVYSEVKPTKNASV